MQEQFTKRASITTGNQQQVGPDYLGLVVNRYVLTVQYNTETIRICCTYHNTKMINASYITILTTKMQTSRKKFKNCFNLHRFLLDRSTLDASISATPETIGEWVYSGIRRSDFWDCLSGQGLLMISYKSHFG